MTNTNIATNPDADADAETDAETDTNYNSIIIHIINSTNSGININNDEH